MGCGLHLVEPPIEVGVQAPCLLVARLDLTDEAACAAAETDPRGRLVEHVRANRVHDVRAARCAVHKSIGVWIRRTGETPTTAPSPLTQEPILDAPSPVEQRELLQRSRLACSLDRGNLQLCRHR